MTNKIIRTFRLQHQIKNVFVLVGVFMALVLTETSIDYNQILYTIVLALGVTFFISSGYYLLNEFLDAKSDRHHPEKKVRYFANANDINRNAVIVGYVSLTCSGIFAAYKINEVVLVISIVFALNAVFYNVKPVRLKDRALLDILCEGANNPIRVILGWACVAPEQMPPSSIITMFWALGCAVMTIKRYSELCEFPSTELAYSYRKSFKWYTPNLLLVIAFFFSAITNYLLGAITIKVSPELILTYPLIALIEVILALSISKKDRVLSKPHKLIYDPRILFSVILITVIVTVLNSRELQFVRAFLGLDYNL